MKHENVRKRIRFAQNFFRNEGLVAFLVSQSSIGSADIVYEIGPGSGIITNALARHAKKVIAVEKDKSFAERARERFRLTANVKIVGGDFLQYQIPEVTYKIFSNIPFNLTADIVKRILFGMHPPKESYVVVQKEAAMKFAGITEESEVSILAKPWFEIKILREFRRTDFEPVPSVDVVFLHISQRERPLVSAEKIHVFHQFVRFGFQSWKKDLKTAFKNVFTHEQWKRLSKNLEFPLHVKPSKLDYKQWIGLFEYFLSGVIPSKQNEIIKRM